VEENYFLSVIYMDFGINRLIQCLDIAGMTTYVTNLDSFSFWISCWLLQKFNAFSCVACLSTEWMSDEITCCYWWCRTKDWL